MVAIRIATLEVQASRPNRGQCLTSPLDLNNSNNMISLVTRRLIAVTNNIIKHKINQGQITTLHRIIMAAHNSHNTKTDQINDKTTKASIHRDQMTGTIRVANRCLPKDAITTFMAIAVPSIIKISITSIQNKITGPTIHSNNLCQVRTKAHSAPTTGPTTEYHRTTMGVSLKRQATIIDSSGTTFTKAHPTVSKSTAAIPKGVPVLMKGCRVSSTLEEVTRLTSPITKGIPLSSSSSMDRHSRVLGPSRTSRTRIRTKGVFLAASMVTQARVSIIPRTTAAAKTTRARTSVLLLAATTALNIPDPTRPLTRGSNLSTTLGIIKRRNKKGSGSSPHRRNSLRLSWANSTSPSCGMALPLQ